jgi:hypothetical protein
VAFSAEADLEECAAKVSLNLAIPAEVAIANAWRWYCPLMKQRRVSLAQEAGVCLKTVVVDGNAKLSRRICGRNVAELLVCEPLGKCTAIACSGKPAYKKRRCEAHDSRPGLDGVEGPPQAEVVVAHRRPGVLLSAANTEIYEVCLAAQGCSARRWAPASAATTDQLSEYWGSQPDARYESARSSKDDITASKCKTHKENLAARFRGGRACGWLLACTPDGYIVHLAEYIGAESLPQRYFFLAEIQAISPATIVFVHDDACHLRKFAGKRAHESSAAKKLAFPGTVYIVDRMHMKNHVDPWCKEHCDPDAECNREYAEGLNTEACEQLNAQVLRHKYMLRSMGQHTAAFFMHELADVRNERFLRKQRRSSAAETTE